MRVNIIFKLSIFCFLLFAEQSNAQCENKYPNSLLSPAYGIVTEDDCAYDYEQREVVPYSSKSALSSLYWQCFSVDNVKVHYSKFEETNQGEKEDFCHLEIDINHNGEFQKYVDHRGQEISYCKNFMSNWYKLVKDQKIVCLNGDGGFLYQDEELKKTYKLWTWEKIKTKNGCYSYFHGSCNTKGCATGKCPQS